MIAMMIVRVAVVLPTVTSTIAMTVMLRDSRAMIVRVAVALPIADDRGDRDDRRGGSRGRGRGSDRNPRYATDDNYDDYRADREERTERPRRRVRRDFDPFED